MNAKVPASLVACAIAVTASARARYGAARQTHETFVTVTLGWKLAF